MVTKIDPFWREVWGAALHSAWLCPSAVAWLLGAGLMCRWVEEAAAGEEEGMARPHKGSARGGLL